MNRSKTKIGKKYVISTRLWGQKVQESFQVVIQGCLRADLIRGKMDLWAKWSEMDIKFENKKGFQA